MLRWTDSSQTTPSEAFCEGNLLSARPNPHESSRSAVSFTLFKLFPPKNPRSDENDGMCISPASWQVAVWL